jgi:hypothetical protein
MSGPGESERPFGLGVVVGTDVYRVLPWGRHPYNAQGITQEQEAAAQAAMEYFVAEQEKRERLLDAEYGPRGDSQPVTDGLFAKTDAA